MAFISRGRASTVAAPRVTAASLPTGVKAPTAAVVAATVFAPDTLYLVKLSGDATYLGTVLTAVRLHTVKGAVAQAIRDKIAAFAAA